MEHTGSRHRILGLCVRLAPYQEMESVDLCRYVTPPRQIYIFNAELVLYWAEFCPQSSFAITWHCHGAWQPTPMFPWLETTSNESLWESKAFFNLICTSHFVALSITDIQSLWKNYFLIQAQTSSVEVLEARLQLFTKHVMGCFSINVFNNPPFVLTCHQILALIYLGTVPVLAHVAP